MGTHLYVPNEVMGEYFCGIVAHVFGRTARINVHTTVEVGKAVDVNLAELDLDSVEMFTTGPYREGNVARIMIDYNVNNKTKIINVLIPNTDPIPVPLASATFGIRGDKKYHLYGYTFNGKSVYLAKTVPGYTLLVPASEDEDQYIAFCFKEKKIQKDHNLSERPKRKRKAPTRFGDWST